MASTRKTIKAQKAKNKTRLGDPLPNSQAKNEKIIILDKSGNPIKMLKDGKYIE